jgi:hypothetical protein
VHTTLDLPVLRASFARIAVAKRLTKFDPGKTSDGFSPSNITFGAIFAADAVLSIEAFAEKLAVLHRAFPMREWTDALVVASRGTVSLALQFFGEAVGSALLPPGQGEFPIMPAYIHLLASAGGPYTLNRLCSLLFAHLWSFSGETGLPPAGEVLEGAPATALTIAAYQFNLQRELVQLTTEQRVRESLVRPATVRIEQPDGTLRCHLQFLPWQNGGYLRLIGQFPLHAILALLGRPDAIVLPREESQLSNVLPITLQDFQRLLGRMQGQGFVVRVQPHPSIVMSKVADEGTASPFVARLMAGMMHLRDQAITSPTEREPFDRHYESVLTALQSCRTAVQEVTAKVREHQERLRSGEIVQWQGNNAQIGQNIDRDLGRIAADFLNSATRALKDGMQRLLAGCGVEIGFLFKKESTFEGNIVKLQTLDPDLAAYLAATRRSWSERLITARNAIEHQGWVLPRVRYTIESRKREVVMTEPTIDGQAVTAFLPFMLERLLRFVEELTAHALRTKLPSGIELTEVLLGERPPEFAQRFRAALRAGGGALWHLQYDERPFEEA